MMIYLASSWRNAYQAATLAALRAAGHEVYDFKNPEPGNTGFSWKQCDPDLMSDLTAERMRRVLAHPVARSGFGFDYRAVEWADACVLLLPSGNSAHLEAGWIGGRGKPVVVCAPEIREPELMYKFFDDQHGAIDEGDTETPIFATVEEVIAHLGAMGV